LNNDFALLTLTEVCHFINNLHTTHSSLTDNKLPINNNNVPRQDVSFCDISTQ
jgi:hypothetical protein